MTLLCNTNLLTKFMQKLPAERNSNKSNGTVRLQEEQFTKSTIMMTNLLLKCHSFIYRYTGGFDSYNNQEKVPSSIIVFL